MTALMSATHCIRHWWAAGGGLPCCKHNGVRDDTVVCFLMAFDGSAASTFTTISTEGVPSRFSVVLWSVLLQGLCFMWECHPVVMWPHHVDADQQGFLQSGT